MKILTLIAISAFALVAGFLTIFFMVLLPSFLIFNLQVASYNASYTIDFISSAALVLAIGLIYFGTQSSLKNRFNLRGRVSSKLARNLILSIIAGVIIGMFYSSFFEDVGFVLVFTPLLIKLELIFQLFLQDVIYQTFTIWFVASFVSICTFDILRTREKNRTGTLRLNNPPTVQ
jgi:hypothetical protein